MSHQERYRNYAIHAFSMALKSNTNTQSYVDAQKDARQILAWVGNPKGDEYLDRWECIELAFEHRVGRFSTDKLLESANMIYDFISEPEEEDSPVTDPLITGEAIVGSSVPVESTAPGESSPD
jgi:hypothetical protein